MYLHVLALVGLMPYASVVSLEGIWVAVGEKSWLFPLAFAGGLTWGSLQWWEGDSVQGGAPGSSELYPFASCALFLGFIFPT